MMKILNVFLLLIVSLNAQDIEDKTLKYTIKPGDTLNIIVFPTEDLSKEVVVQKDGKISMKLLGEIQASGFTLQELSKKIENGLAKYISNPLVSVTLKEFGKRRVYIMGQTKSPGGYDYKDNMKLLELLSLSSGYTNDADLSKVKIFRGTSDKRTVIEVNMEDVVNKGEINKDVELQIDDIVYIPQKGISGWNWFVNDILPSLYLITTVITLYFLIKK